MEHLDSAENMEKVTALAGELKIAGYENARPEQKAEIARTLDFLYARRDEPETRRKADVFIGIYIKAAARCAG